MEGTTNLPAEAAAEGAIGVGDVEPSGSRSLAFLKNSSPASGMSEVSMSFSAIAAISAARFSKIGIEQFPFGPGGFSCTDYPCRLSSIGMDDADYRNSIDQPITSLTHLFGRTFIRACIDRPFKDGRGFLE